LGKGITPPDVFREEITHELKALGLKSAAGSAYASLLIRPESSATDLCRSTGIPDSKIYLALDELQEKGMVISRPGTPRLYRALAPSEAIENLKQRMKQELERTLIKSDQLAKRLEPFYKKSEKSVELELAYILKGQRSVISRYAELASSTQNEITTMMPSEEVLLGVYPALQNATKRGIEVSLAVPPEIRRHEALAEFGQVKILKCLCCCAIFDKSTLLTVSGWESPDWRGIVTQDKTLVMLCASEFSNPKTCVTG